LIQNIDYLILRWRDARPVLLPLRRRRVTDLYFGKSDAFEVSLFHERRVIDEIEMVMSAFDCVLPDDAGIYCSSEITTGRRYYFELLASYGASSEDELKRQLGEKDYKLVSVEFIRPNIARSIQFTEKLRERGLHNLFNPGPFFARGFDQQHYHFLWEWVIIKKIYEIYFNQGWEYSNGCTMEFAIATKKGRPRFDHLGNKLDCQTAIEMIEQALADLRARGLMTPKLEDNLKLIRALE